MNVSNLITSKLAFKELLMFSKYTNVFSRKMEFNFSLGETDEVESYELDFCALDFSLSFLLPSVFYHFMILFVEVPLGLF